MTKKRYHHGDLRTALLLSARKLVAEHGPDGFTMAQAAREAGVSSGAPYKHFADRAELMRALALEGHQAMEARIREATGGIEDPMEQFRQTGITFAVFAVEEPGWFRVMQMPEYVELQQDHPDVLLFWQPLSQLVQTTEPSESLPQNHPLIAQFAARVMVQGLASLLVQGTLQPVGIDGDRARQLADAITQFVRFPEPPTDRDTSDA